jgi:hypothetical protein
MAYKLHELLVAGENVWPSYGGNEEELLKKVVTPIYVSSDRYFDKPPISEVPN